MNLMARVEAIKHIAVDGVYPDYRSIKGRKYPYMTEAYAVIRQDLDKSSTAISYINGYDHLPGSRSLRKTVRCRIETDYYELYFYRVG